MTLTEHVAAYEWRSRQEAEQEADQNLGSVYLVEMQRKRLIKVGFAKDMRNRLASLQTSSPFQLRLVHVWHGYKADEKKLHRLMTAYHYSREWYRYHDDFDELIEDVYDYQLETIVNSPLGDLQSDSLLGLEALVDVPITGFWEWREKQLLEEADVPR